MHISRIAKLCLSVCLLAAAARAAEVTVLVDDVRTAAGQVLVNLCGDPAQPFPGACSTYSGRAAATAGTTAVMLHDVAPGTYALQVWHDENGNGRLDLPFEGYGFGNDAAYPAPFTAASFPVAGDTSVHVHLVHALGNGVIESHGAPAPAGVTRTDLREGGLYGELYMPAQRSRLPLVIAIGGSEGGLDTISSYAAPLAAHGYAVLALAWWKAPGLPRSLENVPLEYFSSAIAWAQRQPGIDPARIAMLGWSRGAEAALLTAARDARVGAVIAVSPTAYVWKGLNFADPGASGPAWTVAGRPLVFATPASFVPGKPMAQMFQDSLADAEHRPDVAIAVEKIRGPILLLSGSDDRLWPADEMSRRLTTRLRARHFTYRVQHQDYAGAGHAIFVGDPATAPDISRLDGFMGGSAAANAAARSDSWQRVLDFLAARWGH